MSALLDTAFQFRQQIQRRLVHHFFNLVDDLVEDTCRDFRIDDHFEEWLKSTYNLESIGPDLIDDQVADALILDLATLGSLFCLANDEILLEFLMLS